MDDKEFIYEKEHLSEVINKIDELTISGEKMKKDIYNRIIEERGRIWEDYSRGAYDPAKDLQEVTPVSYTHLDVYKRQVLRYLFLLRLKKHLS